MSASSSVPAPTGSTRLAAVIGDPVRHSLSPVIHNAGFAALGLDWVYVALPVAAGAGGEAVAAMDLLGIDGLSVTMPHKAAVAAALERRTAAVDRLGVCNCVFRHDDGGLVGDNTDGDGLVRSLRTDDGVDPDGARVMVIGTGGAAASIIEAVGRAGAGEVAVVSRTPERAADACRLTAVARPAAAEEAAVMDVVINASPVGMAGGPQPEGTPVAARHLPADGVVVDIVYQPRRTRLLADAEAVGATAVNGVGMLVYQAAIAFEHWTGSPAPLDAMRTAAFPDA
ncbi:MAG: shikimate dehydrogenase [Actinomycetota bacterium]